MPLFDLSRRRRGGKERKISIRSKKLKLKLLTNRKRKTNKRKSTKRKNMH